MIPFSEEVKLYSNRGCGTERGGRNCHMQRTSECGKTCAPAILRLGCLEWKVQMEGANRPQSVLWVLLLFVLLCHLQGAE